MVKSVQLKPGGKGTALALQVVARANRTELAEVMADGTLRVRLNAPPVDGKANRALIDFLAHLFQVRNNDIEIVAGEHSKKKIVSITGIEPEQVEKVIEKTIKEKQVPQS